MGEAARMHPCSCPQSFGAKAVESSDRPAHRGWARPGRAPEHDRPGHGHWPPHKNYRGESGAHLRSIRQRGTMNEQQQEDPPVIVVDGGLRWVRTEIRKGARDDMHGVRHTYCDCGGVCRELRENCFSFCRCRARSNRDLCGRRQSSPGLGQVSVRAWPQVGWFRPMCGGMPFQGAVRGPTLVQIFSMGLVRFGVPTSARTFGRKLFIRGSCQSEFDPASVDFRDVGGPSRDTCDLREVSSGRFRSILIHPGRSCSTGRQAPSSCAIPLIPGDFGRTPAKGRSKLSRGCPDLGRKRSIAPRVLEIGRPAHATRFSSNGLLEQSSRQVRPRKRERVLR